MGYLHFYTIRKLAHLTEFTALGMVLTGLTGRGLPALLLGAAAGAVDECLQLFSPGRSAQVSDVLLDTLGVFVGILAVQLLCRLWEEK